VAEGKTERWAAKLVAVAAKAWRFGVVVGPTMSRRRPSRTTTIARRVIGGSVEGWSVIR
jgi:hypothetical protein